jgi:hypothetical protein
MKSTTHFTISLLSILTSFAANAQVGIGTVMPKTTLQVIGDAENTTTADGMQVPTLSLAQLDAKVTAYGPDQDGTIVYINDVSVASITTKTVSITSKGVYFYDATANLWSQLNNAGNTSGCGLAVGDLYTGGIIFYLDASGCHGLVSAKLEDETAGRWDAGTQGDTQAKGNGLYAGKANTTIIIAAQVSIGDDNQPYAARICNELEVTEGGITYGDWYLPSLYELSLMNENIGYGNAFGLGNVGGFSDNDFYWTSNQASYGEVFILLFNGPIMLDSSDWTNYIRAVRAF